MLRSSLYQNKYRLNNLCSAAVPAGFLIKCVLDIRQIKERNLVDIILFFQMSVGDIMGVILMCLRSSSITAGKYLSEFKIHGYLPLFNHAISHHTLSSAQMNTHLSAGELSAAAACQWCWVCCEWLACLENGHTLKDGLVKCIQTYEH